MPEDFEEVARHAGRAIRNEATEADARLEEPVQNSSRAKKRVAVVLIAAAAAVAGGFVVINGGSSHTSTPRIATNGSTTTTSVGPTTTQGGFVAVPGQARPFAPLSATFISTNTGWALGKACQGSSCPIALMHTTDGARHWTQVAAPAEKLSGDAASAGVRFANARDGWIFGRNLWSTHDGGAHWTRVALPGEAAAQSMVLEAAGQDVVAVTISDHVTLWSSPVDHDDWRASNVSVNIGAGPIPEAQLAANGSQAWMLLVNRTLVDAARFVNGQWEHWAAPTNANLGGHNLIAARTASDIYVLGDNAFGQWPGTASVKLFTSHDGGSTFDNGVVVADVFNADAFATSIPITFVIAGSGAQNGLFLVFAHNGGTSATSNYVGLPSGISSVSQLGFTTGAQGFLIGTGSSVIMQMSYDGGATWHTVRFPQALVVTK